MDSAEVLKSWATQRTWAESREFLLAHPQLLTYSSIGDTVTRSAAVSPEWLRLLRRAREVGIDAAYGDLLAPWFMIYISRDLTTKIAETGDSSGKMFGLFREHHEIAVVLHLCKRLKAQEVEQLYHDGAKYVEELLLGLIDVFQSEDNTSSTTILAHLETYESLFQVETLNFLMSFVKGFYALMVLADEPRAFRHLHAILDSDDVDLLRLKAITADYIGLFYKNLRSGDLDRNRKNAIRWMNVALATLTEEEYGGRDWLAIKTNLGNAYMLKGGVDPITDAETALRHLTDVSEILSKGKKSTLWAEVQDNLAAVYAQRYVGARSENLRRSIALSEQAEKVFADNNLIEDRIKALINISRANIELGPVFIGRKDFSEPEGVGAELGVLKKAESALRTVERLVKSAPIRGAEAMVYQNLAEVAIQRNELLGEDTLELALGDLQRAAAAADPNDLLRVAYIDYLAAKLAVRRVQTGDPNTKDALALLTRAIDSNRLIGSFNRTGECLFLRVVTKLSEPGLLEKNNKSLEIEEELWAALDLLTAGRDYVYTRHCLKALLQTLWHRYGAADVTAKFRRACDLAIRSAGSLHAYRGIFSAYLASGLALIGGHFKDEALQREAAEILTEASRLVGEQEFPTDWAQIQLMLSKIQRGRLQCLGEDPSAEDLRRAREILQRVSSATASNVELENLLKDVDDPDHGDVGAMSKHGGTRTTTTEKKREEWKPQYSLESDFTRYTSILDTVAIMDRVRADSQNGDAAD